MKGELGLRFIDLDQIIDRDRQSIVVVDHSITTFLFCLDNGVPISSYSGVEFNDIDLIALTVFLEEEFYYPDVRRMIRENFKLGKLTYSLSKMI